jgi:hypothetical protein
MKLIYMLSVGVASVGMTCLVGYASAADTASGNLISDSMLVAQSTPSPGGRGGGTAGEMGRADKGTQSGSKKQGTPGDNTSPEKAKPGTEMDTGGNTGSNSGMTGTSSGSPGSSTGPMSSSGSSGMSGSGSGSSSGAGGGGK